MPQSFSAVYVSEINIFNSWSGSPKINKIMSTDIC